MLFRILLLASLSSGALAPAPALAQDPLVKKKLLPWTPDDVRTAPVYKTWKGDGTIYRWTPEYDQDQQDLKFKKGPAAPNEKKKIDPPKVVGPQSQRAAELSAQSRTDVVGQRETAVTRLGDTASEAGCNGAFCSSTLEAATQATQAAQQLAASASQRQRAAEQERARILQGVQQGVREGQFSQAQAGEMQRLFADHPRPTDQQIEKLHPKLQDPAHALRINGDELTALKATKTEFTEVALNTAQMERKLAGISRRSDSLGAPPAGGAAYPAAASRTPASKPLTAASSLAFRGEAKSGSASGRGVALAPAAHGSDPGAVISTLAPASTSLGLGAPPGGARSERDEAAAARLGADGTAMMAGLFQDLRHDLSRREAPAAGTLGAGKLGAAAGGSVAGTDGSLLGAAVRSVHAEATRGLRGTAEQGTPGKSLFVRVSEAIRKKSAREGGLQ